jgi:hypothetical protein
VQEVLQFMRDSGYKTYIVIGGDQDFVRVYAQRVYGTAIGRQGVTAEHFQVLIPHDELRRALFGYELGADFVSCSEVRGIAAGNQEN